MEPRCVRGVHCAVLIVTYVWVLQLPAYPGLPLQLLEVPGGELLGVDDLGGELEAGRLLHAAADHGEGAPAENQGSKLMTDDT